MRSATRLAFFAVVAVTVADSAFAQAIVDMKGEWSTTGQAVVQNSGAHHPASEPGKAVGEYRLREVKFTYKIEGQDGARFWGSLTSPYRTERLMGSIAGDGKRVYMVDQDGIIDGVLVDADTLDVCYREIKPSSAVVSCNVVKRVKK
jgi:hypothetical protein